MSFSLDQRTLRNGNIYNQNSKLKMSVSAENTAIAPATSDLERVDEPFNGVAQDLIEERIKAILEPLNEQMSR